MASFLVDCNHLSKAIDRVSRVRDRIQHSQRHGHRFITCHHVLCELEVGIQQTASLERNRKQLKRILGKIRIWPLTEQTTQDFGRIHHELKTQGRILSHVDIVLAALARRHRLILLTTDRDFEALPDIDTENWTVA